MEQKPTDNASADRLLFADPRRSITIWMMAALSFPASALSQESWQQGLIQELLVGGLVGSAGEQLTVSPPIVDPQATSDVRRAAAASLAGPRGWNQFSRNSVVAPVRMDLKYLLADDGTRVGQRMHIAFVVHAGIETLRDPDVMQGLLSAGGRQSEGPEDFRTVSIERDALRAMGIEDTESCAYNWLEFVLLKKIELQAVVRSQRTEGDGFSAIAWVLDDRFTDRDQPEDRYRNQWVRRDRDELGKTTRGEPYPYSGAGGYLVVSSLEGIEGASLIEAEIVFAEPEAWFSGSNLLRSKLPLIVQESVRRFRRELVRN